MAVRLAALQKATCPAALQLATCLRLEAARQDLPWAPPSDGRAAAAPREELELAPECAEDMLQARLRLASILAAAVGGQVQAPRVAGAEADAEPFHQVRLRS